VGEYTEISTYQTPAPEDRQLRCRDCRRRTTHAVLYEVTQAGDNEWMRWWEEYRVVECKGCGAVAFQKSSRDTESFDSDGNLAETVVVFPSPTQRPLMDDYDEMPWDIVGIYRETIAAFSASLNVLAAMGIRALVEAVCKERGCKPAKLHQRIDELVSLGVVPQHHADLLHEIRFVGNEAAHALGTVRPKELSEAIDAVEAVLRGVYVVPAVTEEMKERRARREARAKKAIADE